MSSWSEIRARTNDPLSSTINSLIMRQNQANAITDEITDSETIFPVRILNSKLSLNDKDLAVGYSKPVSQDFFMPFEPDGNTVKLWSRFDSGGVTVTDYSCFKNEIEVRHDDSAPQPQLLMTAEDDGVAKNKISSFLEKSKKHYFRITDPQFQLSDNQDFNFFFKIYPTLINNVLENGKRAILLDYIENDQVSHAAKVELDDEGYLYFYVRWDYVDYFVKSGAPLFTFPDEPDYFSQDYDPQDYYASQEDNPFSLPLDFTYIFCTFNKDTKVVTILNPVDEDTVNIWSSSAISIPQTANLSLWLPLSEGGGENLYDISGLDNDGDFTDVITDRKPSWTELSNRRFLEFGERDYLEIERSTSLNTFTSFTISAFVYLHSDFYSIAHSKILFRNGSSGIGRFILYTPTGTARTINLDVANDSSIFRTLTSGGTPLPASTGSWVHIVVTYDGTDYKFYCDKVQTPTTHNHVGDEFTNSTELIVGSITDNNGGHVNIAHMMLWKNVALSLEDIETLYDSVFPLVDTPPAHFVPNNTPPFPPGFDEPPPPPEPGTPTTLPFTQTDYNQQTGTDFSPVKPVTVSGLTEVYNVAGGAPVEDPVVLEYDVAPGIYTAAVPGEPTEPDTTIYNLTNGSDNSHGDLDDSEFAYGQRISSSSSVLHGEVITEISVRLKDGDSNPSGGTLNIGIIKNNGSTIAFGTAISLGSLTSSYQTFMRQNTSNTYVMQTGDAVGIFWSGGSSGQINILRGGSGNHYENSSYSSQCIHDGSSWGNHNTTFSMAATVKTGGGGDGGTPEVTPYWSIVNATTQPYAVGETFGVSSAMLGTIPTKIEFRVHRHASATGNVHLRHVDSSNNTKATLKTQAVSGLPTTHPTTFNFTWEDLTYDKPIAANDKIMVVLSGGNSNPVYVWDNEAATGSPSQYDGSLSILVRRISGGFFQSESWTSHHDFDVCGKIYSGGNNFTGYIHLNDNRKRTGIKVDTDSSTLKTKKITKVTATLKKFGTPAAGAIYCRIRNSAGTLRETINQVDISEVSTSDTSVDFLNTTHNVTLNLDDTLSLEYELGDSSNYIMVRVNKNQFEGVNTILFESLSASLNTATPVNDRDLAALLYTGGETDSSARPRVGLSVNNSNSSLWGKAITKVRLWLKRVGSTFDAEDELSVKVIRGSDKIVVSTLGTIDILDVSTGASGTAYDFENVGNSYVMADDDMIVVENLHGDSSNYIQVKRSATDVIDSTSTCLIDWNGNVYNLTTNNDLNMTAWTGGYTVFPDPNIPTPPTPYHYSHEMFFGASTTPDSETSVLPSTLEPDPETMFDFIAADFRLYQGRLVEGEEAINLFKNKYTISALEFTEVDTVAHSLVGENTE